MPTDLPTGYRDQEPDDWIENDDWIETEEPRSRFERLADFVGRVGWKSWASAAAGLIVLAFLVVPGQSPGPVGDDPIPVMAPEGGPAAPPMLPAPGTGQEPWVADPLAVPSVKDEVRAYYMRMPAPYGRSERGEPLPQPSAFGKQASDVVLQPPGVPTLFSILASRAGLPTGEIGFTIPGDLQARTEPLLSQTVAADGTVVSAMPRALEFLAVAAIVLSAMVVASGIRELIPGREAHRYRYGFREFVYLGNRLIAVLAYFGICSFAVKGSTDLQTAVAIALALAGAWLHLELRWRFGKFLFAVALASAILLLATPVVPPYAALETVYGPAGLYVWDFVGLGVLPAFYVLWRFAGERGTNVVLHTPAPPLVQNVRLVDDRGRR